MTTNLTLHTALGNLALTAPLRDGSVTIPGVTIEDVGKTDYVDIWRTQARTVEYDVSLMSVVSFLCAREYGIPFTCLPILAQPRLPSRRLPAQRRFGCQGAEGPRGQARGHAHLDRDTGHAGPRHPD